MGRGSLADMGATLFSEMVAWAAHHWAITALIVAGVVCLIMFGLRIGHES
jgi:hypothetical protein